MTTLPVNGYMETTSIQPPLGGQTTNGGVVPLDKGKEWQMELLMEKLRSKASTFKPLVETAKNMRMAMLDKRFAIDIVEKNQLQKCLDTLQHSIKVTSLQSMIERLESLSRQLGLKFMMSGPSGTELFISSDMFFLEVLLEPSGAVKDVKIHHEGKSEQQSCEELVSCLSRGDFVDFTTQLEGLTSIYQLNAEKKVKCKAFSALQSLETDLGVLAQLQAFIKEPFNLVHKSPVGILEKRKGGHAMKLTYFVSPYDLIDKEKGNCVPLSLEAVISKNVGHSVTVCMEGSTGHKLPTTSIITVTRGPTGNSTPSYAPVNTSNSAMLPACFVLKLGKKMPMCLELLQTIQGLTELECTDVSAPCPLLSMIVQHASDGQLDSQNNRGLFVTLPDQQHCYFMTENKVMEGVLVGSIPFTHPAHVPQILVYLRQQALFNALLSSCVRPVARQDPYHTTIFEISALSWQYVSVSLEHPFEETMATALLDLTDISGVKCKLYGVNNSEQTSELAGKVLQRCLSIPLTMRTLIKTWEGRISAGSILNSGNGSFNLNLGSGRDQNGHNGHNGSSITDYSGEDVKIKQEPGINGTGNSRQQNQQNQQQQSFLDAGAENSIGFPPFSGQSDTTASMINPLQVGALLGQAKTTSMTSVTPTPTTSIGDKSKKSRKRKGADGSWRSPKRKCEDTGEILLDSSSSDSTPLGTPTGGRDSSNEARTPTPTSSGLIGGLEIGNLDSSDILATDKSSDYDVVDNDADIVEVDHMHTVVEDPAKREKKAKKKEEKKSAASVLEENKNLVSPSVSITPISSRDSSSQSSSYNSMLTGMGLERRPGIEIIPITSISQTNLPSSITITAIAGPSSKSVMDERRERKSSKSRSSGNDDGKSKLESKLDSKLEKKRKRKREESPMGPPEKLPPKPDPLSKPVSVSIKPTESPPSSLGSSRPSSPASTIRKFSPSPTHTSPLAMVGKSSPTLKQATSKPVPSPKHSPVYNSPKHMPAMQTNASPKHGTSSPKHGNSGSAGKPSMSALKSAANSPSGSKSGDAAGASSKGKSSSSSSSASSSSSSSSSSKDSSRDKERKGSSLSFGSSSGHQSPKSKSSGNKTKQESSSADSAQSSLSGTSAGSTTPPSDLSKSVTAQQQARNRKGSLSAVIDKLKNNAQHCTDDNNGAPKPLSASPTAGASSSGSNNGSSAKERGLSSSSKPNIEGKSTGSKNPIETKNPAEYVLKHSSDGMKITINKTRSKDTKSGSVKLGPNAISVSSVSSSSSGNGSPKTHTGLKPGVNSGPASKKPQSQMPKVRSNSPLISSSGSKGLLSGQKMSSSTIKSGSGMMSTSGLLGKGSLKSSSSSGSLSSMSGSPKTSSSGATDLSRSRDKTRFKSGEKGSFASKSDLRKSSPSTVREESDSERAFKLLAHASMSSMSSIPGLPPQLVVEGLMKTLDTKFHIPKLSARVNADGEKKSSSDKLESSKSSEGHSSKSSESSRMLPSSSTSSNLNKGEDRSYSSSSSANAHESDLPTNLSMQPDDKELVGRQFHNTEGGAKENVMMVVLPKLSESHSSSKQYSANVDGSNGAESLNLSTKAVDIGKYKGVDEKEQTFQIAHSGEPAPASSSASSTGSVMTGSSSTGNTSSHEAAEILLDFSSAKDAIKSTLSMVSERTMSQSPHRRNTPPPPPPPPPPLPLPISSSVGLPVVLSSVATSVPLPSASAQALTFPHSPSVSLHIVKSPAPSPRIVVPPSPLSASPCITDDELMDEALVGMGK